MRHTTWSKVPSSKEERSLKPCSSSGKCPVSEATGHQYEAAPADEQLEVTGSELDRQREKGQRSSEEERADRSTAITGQEGTLRECQDPALGKQDTSLYSGIAQGQHWPMTCGTQCYGTGCSSGARTELEAGDGLGEVPAPHHPSQQTWAPGSFHLSQETL